MNSVKKIGLIALVVVVLILTESAWAQRDINLTGERALGLNKAGFPSTVNCADNPVVTTNANSGVGSLRQAIADACPGTIITFDMTRVTSPIALAAIVNDYPTNVGGELVINKSLTISGPGANLLTITRYEPPIPDPRFDYSRIFNVQSGTVTISGLTLSKGYAKGGAIFNSGTLTLTNVTISGNSADDGGGGIYNNGGSLAITNSTVSGNTTPYGPGAGIYSNGGTVTLTNSTVASNTAGQYRQPYGAQPGGGIYNLGAFTLTNSTVRGNASYGAGAGISNGGALALRNTIVAGNTRLQYTLGDPQGPEDINGPVDSSSSFNLIGIGGSGGLINGTNNNQVGVANPGLGALGSNGGPTATFGLLPGSPAINAGSNAFIANPPFSGPPFTDQRGSGFPRITNTTVDIGAVESQGFSISATSGTPQSATITTAFSSPLVATVSSASGEPVAGGVVTFTAPASGASGTFPGNVMTTTATTNAGGVATSPTFTANSMAGGPYDVVASIGTGLSTASFALTNLKGNQAITFGALTNKTFGDPDFTVSATASSGLTVSFTASGQCTIAVSTVHITGAGSCTVTASQSGDANYIAATNVQQALTIAKTNQTITFGTLANKTFGDPDFTVSATASSGLTVSFTASGQCTVSVNTVHVTGAGACTITASQSGDANYNPAPDVAHGFTIDNAPLIMFSQSNYQVNESDGAVAITVTRAGDTTVPVSVDYATDDPGAAYEYGPPSGWAWARCDFGFTLGTLKFAPGETQKTFVIPINRDSYVEGPEIFSVNLSNLKGAGAQFATPASATVTIGDSAATQPPNIIDNTETFVRMQYHDFLNREPDPEGLSFWTGEIDNCTPKPQCTEVKRINVSAAFFLSIEFQSTANLVRSFYVAALDRPATNNMPEFVEFERDTQAMQRGVIVGQGNWQQTLNDNRDAFIKDFVMRAEFVGLYPITDTPTQFIDKLYLHAGVTPAIPEERQAAIDEFTGTTHPGVAEDAGARGRALMRVTENAMFARREANRSFVQVQYFGYLRRNPNDSPDESFAGYDFWLNKLNLFNGNFVGAEMVRAFINSSEYRRRFGL